jgi:hypothetical protein
LFWGVPIDQWTAAATVLSAVATAVLVGVGVWQIRALRNENRMSRTLEACAIYDTDPVLHEAHKALYAARLSGDIEKSPREYRPHVCAILNHLDAIAIGVHQGVYIETIVRDHMEPIIRVHMSQYWDRFEKFDMAHDHFTHLRKLCDEWNNVQPHFRQRKWSFRR